MAQPPTPPPTGFPQTAPPPPSGPYPPYPQYPYYAPPPQRESLVLIVVIVVVVVVVLSTVAAAILYVMVSGLLRGPGEFGPPILLGPVDQTGENATIFIIVRSGSIAPNTLRFSLAANGSESALRDLPPSGGFVAVVAGNRTFRVFWLDSRNGGVLETGDEFLVTGDLAPLPAATTFEFTLHPADGSFQTTIGWTSD